MMRASNRDTTPTWSARVSPRLAALAVLALLAAPAPGRPAGPALVQQMSDTFKAGGKDIRVERFEPREPGKYPAIVLLHAVDGLEECGPVYRFQAHQFAARGYVVLLVHYFDRTATRKEDLAAVREQFRQFFDPEAAKKPADLKAMEQHFNDWKDTVGAAVKYARTLDRVDGKRVGLAGLSLGACLALAAAAQPELRVAAVAELFGGLPPKTREEIKSLPPTLIIHGDADRRIPPEQAHHLRDLVRSLKLPDESHIYQGMGHVFAGARAEDIADADRRVEAFFQKYLKER